MPVAEAAAAAAFADDDLHALFDRYIDEPALVIAVSGGPDSMGLMAAMARWRHLSPVGPTLHVGTINHGLRPEAAVECAHVCAAAKRLGLPCDVLIWAGEKPRTGIQAAARAARYRLLADHARATGATGVVTAHTRSDQSETVLMRFLHGSGPMGLRGMADRSVGADGVPILRPLLWEDRDRLDATARASGLEPLQDPSNEDGRFERVRVRRLLTLLEAEGLDPAGLAVLAGRMRLVGEVLESRAEALISTLSRPSVVPDTLVLEARPLLEEPLAVVQMVLSRVLARVGDPALRERLEAIEALSVEILAALAEGRAHRMTLRGAIVGATKDGRLIVQREPARGISRT